ncbi:hypothetical protein HHI36_001695 [Cryptolaemus montrouzieri]|uniref:Uncharacterized protein n=1 Tax=Cryptolaemus montrouzieri TaxID=559131 RepID=A0ABD2P8E2_9CUCU
MQEPNDVDRFISAELPQPNTKLFDTLAMPNDPWSLRRKIIRVPHVWSTASAPKVFPNRTLNERTSMAESDLFIVDEITFRVRATVFLDYPSIYLASRHLYFEEGQEEPTLEKNEGNMTEDYSKKGLSVKESEGNALMRIDNILHFLGRNLANFNLPLYNVSPQNIISEEQELNDSEENCLECLNFEQRIIFERLIRIIENDNEEQRYFLFARQRWHW